MFAFKEILESLLYVCKEKKDSTLLVILLCCSIGYGAYRYFADKFPGIEGLHLIIALIVLQTVTIMLCLSIFSRVYENKLFFSTLEGVFIGKSGNIIQLLDTLSTTFQATMTQNNNILKLCNSINSNLANGPEIKTSLDMIRVRSQNVVFKCMRILVNYNRDYTFQINKGASESEAKLYAIQNANDALKAMKKVFIDELYDSCNSLSSLIKDDIMQYIDEQNVKMREILDSSDHSCEEKVSSILMMNSSLADSIFTLCRRHIFPINASNVDI